MFNAPILKRTDERRYEDFKRRWLPEVKKHGAGHLLRRRGIGKQAAEWLRRIETELSNDGGNGCESEK